MRYGKIVKGVGGFYYVHVTESGVYECKARGVFRNENVKPLVGDDVAIDVISEEEKEGNVTEILPRKNALIRPLVANVDQALVFFALSAPKPNLGLLDRFLVLMEQQNVPAVICMNKADLAAEEEIERFRAIYAPSGYPIFFFSAKTGDGADALFAQISKKTSVVAGPSGVGKSTLINRIAPHANMETGELSRKIERGKNTTRHAELITVDDETFLVDTPGFSSLSSQAFDKVNAIGRQGEFAALAAKRRYPGVEGPLGGLEGTQAPEGIQPVDEDTLADFFPEFVRAQEETPCRFRGCSHISEPGCAVRAALEDGRISQSRYASYVQIRKELKEAKRY